MWSKGDLQPFYAVTAHWLYEDKNKNIKLATRLIAFHRFWGRHTAKNMANVTLKILDRAGTTANVSFFLIHLQILIFLSVWPFHSRQSGN
jgi:hypothetical protein